MREKNRQKEFLLKPYPITVGEAFFGLSPLAETISSLRLKLHSSQKLYSKLMREQITEQEFLDKRGRYLKHPELID